MDNDNDNNDINEFVELLNSLYNENKIDFIKFFIYLFTNFENIRKYLFKGLIDKNIDLNNTQKEYIENFIMKFDDN